MIEDKIYPVLENPKVDKCFAFHMHNGEYFPYIGMVKDDSYCSATEK